MKKMMLFLVLLSTLSFGQTLPQVVDNSQWFPPVRSQEALRNCTQFALVYYLKSSIWNKKFGRDPKLEVNQFNHNFVWNQTILYDEIAWNKVLNSGIYGSPEGGAFYIMKDYGCATMAALPANERDETIQPNALVKEKALMYKSKKMFHGNFRDVESSSSLIGQRINALKDSLSKGKNFTLNITIFHYFDKMTTKNNVYNAYEGMIGDSMYYRHSFTVVGYNDTIKTDKGRGAFQIINSYAEPAGGRFYLDYNWFYFYHPEPYDYFFLEEDFSSYQPINNAKPVFTQVPSGDLTVLPGETASFTFKASDPDNNPILYSLVSGTGAVLDVNSGTFSYQANSVGDFMFTVGAGDGYGITLKTFKVSVKPESVNNPPVFTPLSNGELLALQGEAITYQFQASDPEGSPIVYAVTNGSGASINTATGLFSYKSVIDGNFPFSVSANDGSKITILDFIVRVKWNATPSFTKLTDSPTLQVGDVFKFQFVADDPEKKQIVFSVDNVVGATIVSSTGELRYAASAVGTFVVKITVSDGFSSSTLPFTIFVKESQANQSPIFTQAPNSGLTAIPGALVNYQFKASDPENAAIVFAIVSGTGASLNSTTGVFEYQTVNSGTFLFTVSASDGVNVVNSEFSIIVKLNNAPVFTSKPSDQILLSGSTFKYKFVVSDQEGDQVTFAISEGAGAYINPNSGDFTFTGIPSGTFTFKITASDYYNVSTFTFKIKVEENVVDTPPVFTQVPNGDLVVVLGQVANFTFKASDTEGSTITYKIGGGLGANIDAATGLFTYQPSQAGRVAYRIDASDGVNTVSTVVNIKTEAPVNNAPTFINPPENLTAYTNKTFTYQFDAKDDDNDALTFSILNSLPEAQISSSGKLTFISAKVNTYRFTVVVSDGKTSTNLAVAIKVDLSVDVEEIEIPEYSVSVYPNPIASNMNIKLQMKRSGSVTMSIYDMQGRQIATTINQCEAGENMLDYDASNLRSGTYICKFASNTFNQTIKILKQ